MSIFPFFILIVILAPLPFGMVHALTQAIFACGVFALTAAYCMARVYRGYGPDVTLGRIWPECVLFVVVAGWSVVQISPMAPEQWHHPLWSEAGAVLGADVSGALSLARGAGIESLMRMFMYAAVFWLALQTGRDRKRARQIITAVAAAATIYALYWLAGHFGGHEKVLWVEKTRYVTDLTGPFVNRNTFATYLGLGLLCGAGLYLADFFKALETRRTGKDRALHLVQQAFVRGAPQLACILILLTSLFLTNSRAGVTCSLAALVVLVMFMGPLNRIYNRFYQGLTASLVAAVLVVFFLSGEGWVFRLTATDIDREQRITVYEQTWQAIGHAPLTGYGAGSFEQTFPVFAGEDIAHYDKAHNDWLEIMFELGVPAAVALFAVIGGLGLRCLAGYFTRRRDHVYALCGLCACILAGLHSLVDFSLQVPAVAVTFFTLLGVGVAQSRSSADDSRQKPGSLRLY